jgi:hypothetical protein
LCLLGGCGIPTDSTATRLQNPVFNSATSTTSTTSPSATTYSIYYLLRGHLVAETRYASAFSLPTLLTLLIQPPSSAEARQHVVNALSPNQPLELASPALSAAGIVTVELPLAEFAGGLTGAALSDAYGQIVYSLMDAANDRALRTRISGVAFELNGAPWPPKLPKSVISVEPYVTTADYAALAPVPATPAYTTVPTAP